MHASSSLHNYYLLIVPAVIGKLGFGPNLIEQHTYTAVIVSCIKLQKVRPTVPAAQTSVFSEKRRSSKPSGAVL
jgi:hypothetical protein